MRFLLAAVFTLLFAPEIFAQEVLLKKVQLDSTTSTVERIFLEIESKSGTTFMYSNAIDPQKLVRIDAAEMTIQAWLDKLFDGHVRYHTSGNKIILRTIARTTKPVENMTLHGY